MARWLIFLFALNNIAFTQTLKFSSPNSVTTDYTLVKRLKVVDYNQDGLMDVVAASSNANNIDDNIAWFENTGSGFTKRSVDSTFQNARSVDVGFIDDDSDLDIVAASRTTNPITWYDNTGVNTWTKNTLLDSCLENHSIQLVDLNQDGYLDIVSAMAFEPGLGPDSCVFWYENSSVSPGTFTYRVINNNFQKVISLDVVDLDNDNDLDIVLVEVGLADEIADDEIAWLENDGNENFTQREINYSADAPMYVHVGDVDKDGDNDVLISDWGHVDGTSHDVVWYENDGLAGGNPAKEWTVRTVDNLFLNARSTIFYDLDGDDDLDIVGAACDQYGFGNDGYITYWVNDGTPLDGGWSRTDLIDNFNYAYHAVAEDMDDDGDLDIVGSAQNAGDISWWENQISDDIINITTNTNYDLWNNKIRVSFDSGPSGTEYVKAFYKAGRVPDRSTLGSGVDHVAQFGYYTLKTDESNYTVDLWFSYSGIENWSAISDESDLIMCYWDGSKWERAADQSVFMASDSILVRNFSRSDNNSVIWTLGSSTTDNPLPVQLVAFTAQKNPSGIELKWKTKSELNNLGFELHRKSSIDSTFIILSSYTHNNNLRGLGNSNLGREYNYIDETVLKGLEYTYRIVDISNTGKRFIHEEISFNYISEGLERSFSGQLPETLVLSQNYPNPFNGTTRINFSVPDNLSGERIQLIIYNDLGQKVRSLFDNSIAQGNYSFTWDGKNQYGESLSSGMYIYLLHSAKNSLVKRMTLIK